MIRWIGLVMSGLAVAALPIAAESRAGDGVGDRFTASIPSTDPVADDGGFEMLSAGNRKIALALFDAQGRAIGNDVAWTLDEIAAAKQSGTAWSAVFKRMRAEGLTDEPNLGAVISRAVRRWNARAPAPGPGGGTGNRAPMVRRGAHKTLAAKDREIAEVLFESQSIGRSGTQAWSLDQIATAKQNGARWQAIVDRLRTDDLIRARTLDGVFRRYARLAGPRLPPRKVVITNGKGRHVVITTRSRRPRR